MRTLTKERPLAVLDVELHPDVKSWSITFVDAPSTREAVALAPEWAPLGWDEVDDPATLSQEDMEILFLSKLALTFDFSIGDASDTEQRIHSELLKEFPVSGNQALELDGPVPVKGYLWPHGEVSGWMEFPSNDGNTDSPASRRIERYVRQSLRLAIRTRIRELVATSHQ